jgi:hypothetical protein
MAKEAARYNMSIGLKNSDAILSQVQDVIQFAVNEECAAMGECSIYKSFLKSKPVFHIEYTKTKSAASSGYESAGSSSSFGGFGQSSNSGSRSGSSSGSKGAGGNKGSGGFGSLFGKKGNGNSKNNAVVVPRAESAESAAIQKFCTPTNAPDLGPKFSTVIKVEALDGWVRFCDGRVVTTRINNFDDPKGKYAAEEEESIPVRGGFGGASKSGAGARGSGSGGQWGYPSRVEDSNDDDD